MIELIGDDPEAAEAALLQAYPGRNPIVEVLTGAITLRSFRVMVEHLPPGNALARSRGVTWDGHHGWLLVNIEARLRELHTLITNVHLPEGVAAAETSYLDLPDPVGDRQRAAAQQAYDDLMQQQLENVWAEERGDGDG